MSPVAVLAGVPIGGDHPVRLMAAINVSPESFFAGSVRVDDGALREAAQRAVEEGADIIDIGAKSTAPYLDTAVPLDEEVRRMSRAVQVVDGGGAGAGVGRHHPRRGGGGGAGGGRAHRQRRERPAR